MIFLLDLPKPIHGLSVMNKAFIDKMSSQTGNHFVINTTPSYAVRFYNGYIWTLVKFFHTTYCVLRLLYILLKYQDRTIYRPINGGWGQFYDLLFIVVIRLFGCKIYIHHHSFKYLHKKTLLFTMINRLSFRHASHIVLAGSMKSLLCKNYFIADDIVFVLSNLALLEFVEKPPRTNDNSVLKIGFLSDCTVDKGIDVFIDVCQILVKNKIEFSAEIAGPLFSKNESNLVSSALKTNANIKYLGSLYGEDKCRFFERIDCFIFPSKYAHEAEPVVLYEAAFHGTLLIATKQGAVESVMAKLGGICISTPESAYEITKVLLSGVDSSKFNYSERLKRKILFESQKKIEEASSNDLIQVLRKSVKGINEC